MAISKAILKKLIERDDHCWHCGTTETLAPHHRRNRQMGGSTKLDRLDNLIRVCSAYNGAMESDPQVARQAKDKGHKLSSWDDFNTPVFDIVTGLHYLLDSKGGKGVTEPPSYLI